MTRPRQRACFEHGLKLDINDLARRGLLQLGARVAFSYRWTNSESGELVATAQITTHCQTQRAGWCRIRMGKLDQCVDLVAQPRHFGGRQWYFRSPITHLCSVLRLPPGAKRFYGRHEWEGRVAYASQFESPVDRAHRGKHKIKSKLIGELDPDEWALPPKPKGMRWQTYNEHVAKFDRCEELLDNMCLKAALRLGFGIR